MDYQKENYATIDDLLYHNYRNIIENGREIVATKGSCKELISQKITLANPRSRISLSYSRGKVISCIGDFFWMLSGTNSLNFIQHYIPNYPDDGSCNNEIDSSYGKRFRNEEYNQINNLLSLLRKKRTTRRAILQIFSIEDVLYDKKEIPCTNYLQFLIRDEKLHLIVNMRSNDAFLGMPHDIFCFSMLQEIVSSILNVKLGEYHHNVGSLHIYEKDFQKAEEYISEGLQSTNSRMMGTMPKMNDFEDLLLLLSIEKNLRTNNLDIRDVDVDQYWLDIFILIFLYTKNKNSELMDVDELIQKIENPFLQHFAREKFY